MKNKDLIAPIFLMPVILAIKAPRIGRVCVLMFLIFAGMIDTNRHPELAIVPIMMVGWVYFLVVFTTLQGAIRSKKVRGTIRELWNNFRKK